MHYYVPITRSQITRLLQITTTKTCKLNAIITYTKMANNDDMKQFFKKFPQ